MDDKDQILELIQFVKRKLQKNYTSSFVQHLIFYGALTIFVLALTARWMIIIHFTNLTLISVLFVSLCTSLFWYSNRPTTNDAISIYDEVVMDNRVSTAYSFLNKHGEIVLFQRKDTVHEMKLKKHSVMDGHKGVVVHWKILSISILLLIFTLMSFSFPSHQMLAATDLRINKELVDELEDLISEVDESEDDQLQGLLDQLIVDITETENAEGALDELLRIDSILEYLKLDLLEKEYKLNHIKDKMHESGLNELSAALDDNDVDITETLQKMEEQLEIMSDKDKKAILEELGNVIGEEIVEELTVAQIAKLKEELEKMLETDHTLNSLVHLQQELEKAAVTFNNKMVNSGLSDNPNIAGNQFANNTNRNKHNGLIDDDQTPNQSNGEPTMTNNGEFDGANSSLSDGTDNEGSMGGTESGSSGASEGDQGVGSGQGSRELVTIPERMAGEENLEVDDGMLDSGTGTIQESYTSPILRGSVRPYQEVIGKYESSYRESINRMQLPKHIEDIVRDYFTELNLEQE